MDSRLRGNDDYKELEIPQQKSPAFAGLSFLRYRARLRRDDFREAIGRFADTLIERFGNIGRALEHEFRQFD
jgi:hypothetical protein